MHRNLSAVLLSAALLLCLSGCTAAGEESTSPSPSASPSPSPSPSRVLPTPRPSATPEPADLSWEPDHQLDTEQLPVLYGGLELPIRGATGYTSIELPLWPEPQPEAPPEPSPVTEPEPSSQPSTPPSPSPETSPIPSQEPAPSPEVSPSPQPSPSPETSSGTEETPSAQPQPEPTQSPAEVSPPPQPTLSPTPESSPDPQPAISPAATPAPSASSSAQPSPSPEPDPYAGALEVLPAGTAFTILKEEGDWWQVRCGSATGWVEHLYCMINLPDVIPSMIYDATNSYDSRYRSSGKALEGVTGQSLYPSYTYNARLDRQQFMMPVLYSTALKLCAAQQAALAQGNSIVLYEAYRPHSTQKAVVNALSALSRADEEVRAGISTAPWKLSWFIATGYSNHQRGYAVDVGLAKVWSTRLEESGGYSYLTVEDYDLYEMPSPIHELSIASVTFASPVATNSTTAWRSAGLADTMNEPAVGLQSYFAGAGMTPLSSEWWHFNDLETRTLVRDRQGTGNFTISRCVSTAP